MSPLPARAQVVERLEATVRVKRFNALGGLQLDRDVRALVSTLSGLTQRTVRDKFAVLNQARISRLAGSRQCCARIQPCNRGICMAIMECQHECPACPELDFCLCTVRLE